MTFYKSPPVCRTEPCFGCDSCDKNGKKRCKHEWFFRDKTIKSLSLTRPWTVVPVRECLKCKKIEQFITISYWEEEY